MIDPRRTRVIAALLLFVPAMGPATTAAQALASNPPLSSGATEGLHPFEVIRSEDIRVGRTFFHLATANADACPRSRAMTGLLVHDLLDYPRRARGNLATLFERQDAAAAYAVIPGSPAASAGLRVGDGVIAIAGRSLVDVAAMASAKKALVGRAVEDAISDALREGPAELVYVRGGKTAVARLAPLRGCDMHLVRLPAGRPNSFASSDTIAVTAGLLRLAQNDAQLAAVLGHEMAHIIFDARSSGGSRVKGPAVELAADRAGLIMAARAGYDPVEARILWSHFHHGGLMALFPGEHPPDVVRRAGVEKALAEVAAQGDRIAF